MEIRNIFHKKTSSILFILLLTLISFLIRSYHIGSESLYGDEPYSIFHAQKSLPELKEIFLHDQNPPMHIGLLHFWLGIFGVSDVSAKMLSIVCSVLAGIVLFLFSKKYLNVEAAIIVFLLFLFSNSQQFYSTEVRPYALIQLLCISSFYIYFNLLTDPKKKQILFLFLVNLLLLFTHYLSVFILVVQFLFIWFYFKENKKGFTYYFISQLLLVVAFLPWVSVLFANLPKEGTFWNHAPNYGEFRWHTNVLIGNETLFYVFNGIVIVSLLFIFGNKYYKALTPKFNTRYYFLFLTLYVLPIILDFIVSQKTPVFLTRYILYTTFGLFLSVGYIYSCLEKKGYKFLFIVPFLLLILTSFKIKQDREDDWKKMVPIVKNKQDKNTVIFVCASYKFKDFAFYYDIDAFKNYDKSAELLARDRVYFSADDQWFGWNKLNYAKINQIIYIHSHAQFEDPDNKITEFILNKGFRECGSYNWVNTGYTLYIRDSLECNPIKIISEIPNINCDIMKHYIGIDATGDTAFVFKTSFEKEEACSSVYKITDEKAAQGKYSYKINGKDQFSPGIMKKVSELENKNGFTLSAEVLNEPDSNGDLVVSVEKNGKSLFRSDFIINEKLETTEQWKEITTDVILPENLPPDADVKIYFWNSKQGNLFIDKFKAVIYRR
jgi:mannosyltransferase